MIQVFPGLSMQKPCKLMQVASKQVWDEGLLLAESCDLNCLRRRSEKRLRKTIRTLRKSINREQFHLHFAGADYELSRNLGQSAELQGHCGAGQVLVGRKCGEFDSCASFLLCTETTLNLEACTTRPGMLKRSPQICCLKGRSLCGATHTVDPFNCNDPCQ